MIKEIVAKEYFSILGAILLLTDLTILLNIPFLRQIIGFLFLTILPGLLILQILKLDKLDFLEKFILSWGLSISFLMFFGLLLNNLSLSLGYETPLATIPLLISFNIAFIVLAIIGYKLNKSQTLSLPNLNLNTSEKAFLTIPIIFPALSIVGMHIMNTTDNNVILMFLLFLIPIYVAFVCFFNHKFPKRLYPVVIFLISISLLLLIALRSNHIMIGADTGREFYLFRITLNNLCWNLYSKSTLDACISISLLPAIYQSLLNTAPEYLFKILYALLYSICPLIVYILSKRYIEESYAFLASCFFLFQGIFLITASIARVSIAILFFALSMMVLFNNKIEPLKKRILFIIFMISCVLSHYSTTYLFFFIIFGVFVGIEALSIKYTFKKNINTTMLLLFFAVIFFWYSQATGESFESGVTFVERTITSLNNFFIEEMRRGSSELLGVGLLQSGIPHMINFTSTWLTFILIGVGVITLIKWRKTMSFPELKSDKVDFLKEKFQVEYFLFALTSTVMLLIIIVLPYVTRGYDLHRAYPLAITILSPFFVIGGIVLSRYLKISAYLIILLVLIPYFLSVSGVTYQMFGDPHSIILNSYGERYNEGFIINDQDHYASRWIANYVNPTETIYTTPFAWDVLPSQGLISPSRVNRHIIQRYMKYKQCEGYVYLRYRSIPNRSFITYGEKIEKHSIEEFPNMLATKSLIYSNDDSEVWD